MTIIPAIDLLDGRCVRLYQGDYNRVTDYETPPADSAREFVRQGITRIHVVDLSAARGSGDSREAIAQIVRAADCTVEVGGGIRTERDVVELLECGVKRLILGTVLVKEPARVKEWIRAYGKVFVAGIDARDGMVKVSGWEASAGIGDLELGRRLKDMGFLSVIYTNISKDGTLSGPDLESTNAMVNASGLPVILSGGIGSMEDVSTVAARRDPGIVGVITGKAYYEGLLDLKKLTQNYPQEAGEQPW